MRSLFGAFLLFAFAASGATLPPPPGCPNASLDTYISMNALGCQLGDLVLTQFSYLTGPDDNVLIPTTAISVRVVGNRQRPGLLFESGKWNFSDDGLLTRQIADIIGFQVTVASDARLAIGGALLTGFELVQATTKVCFQSAFEDCQGPDLSINPFVLADDSFSFDPPVNSTPVNALVEINSSAIIQTFGELGNFTIQFVEVPEPRPALAIALALMTLAGIGLRGRRREPAPSSNQWPAREPGKFRIGLFRRGSTCRTQSPKPVDTAY